MMTFHRPLSCYKYVYVLKWFELYLLMLYSTSTGWWVKCHHKSVMNIIIISILAHSLQDRKVALAIVPIPCIRTIDSRLEKSHYSCSIFVFQDTHKPSVSYKIQLHLLNYTHTFCEDNKKNVSTNLFLCRNVAASKETVSSIKQGWELCIYFYLYLINYNASYISISLELRFLSENFRICEM